MSKPALTLRHLSLTGPDKDQASVTFGHGLNVIYGASETGKFFIVEVLDFMLGASADSGTSLSELAMTGFFLVSRMGKVDHSRWSGARAAVSFGVMKGFIVRSRR